MKLFKLGDNLVFSKEALKYAPGLLTVIHTVVINSVIKDQYSYSSEYNLTLAVKGCADNELKTNNWSRPNSENDWVIL